MKIYSFLDDKLAKRAIDVWGAHDQIATAIEECSELATVLARYLRGRPQELDDIAEEIADVIHMTYQLTMLFDEELIIEWLRKKVKRTESRLQEIECSKEIVK